MVYGIPSIDKLVLQLATQQVAKDKKFCVDVLIRLKPSGKVLAKSTLAKGALLPIISNNIQECDKSALAMAAFRSNDKLHVAPGRVENPVVKDKSMNPGSMVRLVHLGAALVDTEAVNAKMTLLMVPIIVSFSGNAVERVAAVPAIELVKEANAGDEIVAMVDRSLIALKREKSKKVITTIGAVVKPSRIDPLETE